MEEFYLVDLCAFISASVSRVRSNKLTVIILTWTNHMPLRWWRWRIAYIETIANSSVVAMWVVYSTCSGPSFCQS